MFFFFLLLLERYRILFNYWLTKLRKSGVLSELVTRWWGDLDRIRHDCATRERGEGEEDGADGFGLGSVSFFFWVVHVGAMAAVAILAGEKVAARYAGKKEKETDRR